MATKYLIDTLELVLTALPFPSIPSFSDYFPLFPTVPCFTPADTRFFRRTPTQHEADVRCFWVGTRFPPHFLSATACKSKSKVNGVRLLYCLSLIHLELSLPFASRSPTCFLLEKYSGGNMEKGGGSLEKLLKRVLG